MEKKVLAFHYAWYGTPWGEAEKWLGWGGGKHDPGIVMEGRRTLKTPHYPLDGPYDSLSEETIRRQLDDLKLGGMDGFIVSWWWEGHYSRKVLKRMVELAPEDSITVYYETAMTFDLRDEDPRKAVKKIAEDFKLLLNGPATEKSWIEVEGKPLIVAYIVENYTVEEWKRIREEVGEDFFLLGDTLNPDYLEVMDGLHTYSPVGILTSGKDLAEVYRKAAEACRSRGDRSSALFAATVCPGYDDRKIRSPGLFLPRGDGATYRETWRAALACKPDWILICTYNEWLEGTEIEPSREYGLDYLFVTRQLADDFKG